MYFAWLGFYTNSMLYPAVIGFLLWILAEADQVRETLKIYSPKSVFSNRKEYCWKWPSNCHMIREQMQICFNLFNQNMILLCMLGTSESTFFFSLPVLIKYRSRSIHKVGAAHSSSIELQVFLKYLLTLSCSLTDQSGYLLCGFCPLQRCVGHAVSGALEEARGRAGLQVGHTGLPGRVLGGAKATVQGEDCCIMWAFMDSKKRSALFSVYKKFDWLLAVFVQIKSQTFIISSLGSALNYIYQIN